jgi:phage terminase large subunit-like protein
MIDPLDPMAQLDIPENLGATELRELEAMILELRKREILGSRDSMEFYPKQKEFLFSTADVTAMFSGNQGGKSHTAAYAMACDLEGVYPEWWQGARTKNAIRAWCVGVTNESTRDNCQFKLWGPDYENPGGGWINPEKIVKYTRRQGVAGAIDTIWVKHISGEVSMVTFKANEMGREKLQGPSLDRIWCDEEIDKDVFDELMFRTIARPGALVRLTFTPLKGMTELVISLEEGEDGTGIKIIRLKREDMQHPDGRTHMTAERRAKIIKMYSGTPHLLKARLDGEATQGAGLIYQCDWSKIFVKPFPLESWMPRIGGMDFGWRHPTVAMVAAYDRDADSIYIYGMHHGVEMDPRQHVNHLIRWGDIDYAADPAGLQSDKASGVKLMEQYNLEFNPAWKPHWDEKRWRVFPADNGVSAGIARVQSRLESSRLFIFDTPEFELLRKEARLYKYDDESNRPVKKNDDAMDTMRYLVGAVNRARLQGKTLNPLASDMVPKDVPQWKPRPEGY